MHNFPRLILRECLLAIGRIRIGTFHYCDVLIHATHDLLGRNALVCQPLIGVELKLSAFPFLMKSPHGQRGIGRFDPIEIVYRSC